MPRTPLPLVIEDASRFADALRQNWPETSPGHLQAMNVVARAAGYRSWQVLKATTPAPMDASDDDLRRVQLALRVFDSAGLIIRWPKGYLIQRLCIAAIWSRVPSNRDLTEREINAQLKSCETFGDHVLLRRSLIDHRFMKRTTDGSIYRRIERSPTPAERVMIRSLSERWAALETRPATNAT